MDRKLAQKLYRKYAQGVVYVATEGAEGDHGIGTAFHVGECVFVTARHVVENRTITEVRSTIAGSIPYEAYIPITREQKKELVEYLGFEPHWPYSHKPLQLVAQPVYHADPRVDVAVFRTNTPEVELPYLNLGSHLDEFVARDQYGHGQFILSEAVVLGYPPVPMTTEPVLIAARAEVNCVTNTWKTPNCQFILSATPRGGFSGGVAISEFDFVLGMVTDSLVHDGAPLESGFMNVISIEPILKCLGDAKLLPACQRKKWGDLWSTRTERLTTSEGKVAVSVGVCDDGSKRYLDVLCDDEGLRKQLEAIVQGRLNPSQFALEHKRVDWLRWTQVDYGATEIEPLQLVVEMAIARCESFGLRRCPSRR